MTKLAAHLLALGLLLSQGTISLAGTPEETLERARELVSEKQYDAALSEYEKIADWLWRDPGLVIERARVYAYADRHKEAIELYEEVLDEHPEQA